MSSYPPQNQFNSNRIANLIDTPEPHDFSPHESLPDALVAIELPSTAPTASLSSPQSPLKLNHRSPPTKQEPVTLSQHPLDEFDLAIKLSFDVAPASVLDSRDGNEERRLEDSSSLLVSRKRKLESENEDEDADYVSSKKMSKKSRTLLTKSRRRKRKRISQDRHDVDDEMSYGNEVLEDPSKLYCYCQLPHNDDLFYIQCDECNQWFCSKCTFLKESQLDSIILFYCIPCETITGKKTFRRRLCAAYEYTKKVEIEMEDAMDDDAETNPKSTPQLPQLLLPTAATNGTSSNLQISKRIRSPTPNQNLYTHPPTCKTYVPHESDSLTQADSTEHSPYPKILDTKPSFYCSETCGTSLAQHRLKTALPTLPSKSLSRRISIQKRQQTALKILHPSERPSRLPQPATNTLARLDAKDQASLRDLQHLSNLSRSRIHALQTWARRIDAALERADLVSGFLQPGGSKVFPGVSAVCGFDSRMRDEWVVPCWKEWIRLSEETRLGLEKGVVEDVENLVREEVDDEGEEGEVVEMKKVEGWEARRARVDTRFMCMVEGKCSHHVGWRILRITEVETEINLAMQDLETNNQAMQRIIDGMRRRRDEARFIIVEDTTEYDDS